MKKSSLGLLIILLSTISSCGYYMDAILGTDVTFDKKRLTESILEEVKINEKYYNKEEIVHSQAGTSIDDIQNYILLKIELQRTHYDNRSTSFIVKYLLDEGKGKPITLTESRIIYNEQDKSTILSNAFLENYCLKNQVEISDRLKYYWKLKYVSDDFYILFGKNMMLMTDPVLGQTILADCEIFTNENIPFSYSKYSFMLNFSKNIYFFVTLDKIDHPIEGPFSKYQNAIKINLQLFGSEVNDFLLNKTVWEVGIDTLSLGTLNDMKVENKYTMLLSGKLTINKREINLSPYITSKMTREVKFK